MFERRRPRGRIFLFGADGGAIGLGCERGGGKRWRSEWGGRALAASGGAALPGAQSGPALTSVVDTVYRGDGSAAQGLRVITWPAFAMASGAAVAAGAREMR